MEKPKEDGGHQKADVRQLGLHLCPVSFPSHCPSLLKGNTKAWWLTDTLVGRTQAQCDIRQVQGHQPHQGHRLLQILRDSGNLHTPRGNQNYDDSIDKATEAGQLELDLGTTERWKDGSDCTKWSSGLTCIMACT